MKLISRKVIDICADNFNFTMTAGAGKIYDTIADIPKSYLEARTALEYKMVKGKGQVICFNEIDDNRHERYYYSNQHEGRIINYLKTGDFDGIHEVLSKIFEDDGLKSISVMMARCMYFDIINTAMKVLAELKTEDYNQIMSEENFEFPHYKGIPVSLRTKCGNLMLRRAYYKRVFPKGLRLPQSLCSFAMTNKKHTFVKNGGTQNKRLLFLSSN